ncbi:uncharacterized protein LOC118435467 [Folsomia candida]|nr:uncharacterized protein LOC118435467 [Folsomia candida]
MGLGGGNTAAQTTQSMSPGGKMNLIINLHQNVTSPPQMQQQSAGFAAVPLKSFYNRGTLSSSLSMSNETSMSEANLVERQESSQFDPFVLLPLVAKTTPPPPTSSPPPPIDPLQQLVGFLYSVGYVNNSTGPSKDKVSPFPPFPAEITDEDDSEEEKKAKVSLSSSSPKKVEEEEDDAEDDESDEGSSRNGLKSGIPHRKKKFSKNFAPLRKNEADFIRIKSSQRTGRFHHHSVRRDDDDPGVASRPQFYGGIVPPPHPEMPILFRAFRFFSTMLRGGPMG